MDLITASWIFNHIYAPRTDMLHEVQHFTVSIAFEN